MKMKEIPLSQGFIALVDNEDYERVNQYKWYAGKYNHIYYAKRSIFLDNTTQRMHRFILNAPKGIQIDHEDHNGLNNQKYNLRLATNKQNGANQQKQIRHTSSKYKGVSWDKNRQKWMTKIKIDSITINLGRFENEIEAALAYDAAAIIHFGEFACLNFPHASSNG